jgi:L-lactate dehydrogenase complex protein LldF
MAMRALARAFGDERRLARAQRLSRRLQRPFVKDGQLERLPGLASWLRTRDLPSLPEQTFREWWQSR